jgi:PA14 domain
MYRDLRVFMLYATGIHGALFAWAWLVIRPGERRDVVVHPTPIEAVNVDREPAEREEWPPSTRPGGGSQNVCDVKDSRPAPAGVAPTKSNVVLAPKPLVGVDTRQPAPADAQEAQPDLGAVRAAIERRDRDLEMAAAAAAALADPGMRVASGRGEGANGGPGGRGAGSGTFRAARVIRGANAFGNGSHGALTGRVCFLPVGTLRIAQVRDCQYVATVYTDTLNIPERQFYDGFPGVTDRSDWFLIDYTGTFTVSTNGTYRFRLHSDDGSYLYVDDHLVIDNDGKHAPLSRSGAIALDAGEHQIKVRYAQTTDRMALQLFVRTPQAQDEKIFTTRL